MNLSDYVAKFPDSYVAWHYNHISRYPNLHAAEQWLTAKMEAEIEYWRYNHFTDLAVDTGIESHADTAKACYLKAQQWEKVAEAFHALLYKREDDSVDTGLCVLNEPYKKGVPTDDMPF